VDDEADMVALLKAMLTVLGHSVVGLTQSTKALGVAGSGEPFDLALLDVVMPDVPGDILAAQLRHHHPDLPILFVTGHDEALFRSRPQLTARESFLRKPFTLEALSEAVALAIGGTTSPPN